MSINDLLDNIVAQISASIPSSRVVKAYPNEYKPTRLSKPHIAVSYGGEEITSVGISGYAKQIDTRVIITLYVSYEDGMDTILTLAKGVQDSGIMQGCTAFSIAGVSNNDTMDILGLKITLGYRSYDIDE